MKRLAIAALTISMVLAIAKAAVPQTLVLGFSEEEWAQHMINVEQLVDQAYQAGYDAGYEDALRATSI